MVKVEPGSTDSPSSVAGLGGPKVQSLKVKQAAAQSACCRVLVTKSREHGRPSFAFVDGAGNCRACGCHGCKDHMICSSCSDTVVCCSCDCYSDEQGHTVSDDCSRHRGARVTSETFHSGSCVCPYCRTDNTVRVRKQRTVKKERQAGDTTAQEKFRSDSGLAPLDLAQALWVHGAPRMPDANLLDYENEQLAFMWHFVIKWKCNGDVTPSTYVWKGEGKERSRQEWDTRFSALQTRQLVLGRYNPLYSLGLRVPEKNPAPGSRARALYGLLVKAAPGLLSDFCQRRTLPGISHYDVDWARWRAAAVLLYKPPSDKWQWEHAGVIWQPPHLATAPVPVPPVHVSHRRSV